MPGRKEYLDLKRKRKPSLYLPATLNMGEILYRRNAVLEAIKANRRACHKLWYGQDARNINDVIRAADSRNVPVEQSSKSHLTRLAGDASHQGVVLECGPYKYSDVDEILTLSSSRGEMPFVLLMDLLQGPHNIGTLLRTAAACGVHGVVIQDRRAPEITPQVVLYSAGAVENLLVAQVTNLVRTIKRLKDEEIWLIGLDLTKEAVGLGQVDLNMSVGIIVGHEGGGLRRLVRQSCDYLLKLPMREGLDSLNAAVAGSILLYACWQARDFQGAAA